MILPLLYVTPEEWVEAALSDRSRLLNDHAHLEAKAASNALALLSRFPGAEAPRAWVSRLCRTAREEMEHLKLVLELLERRGGSYSKSHRNRYAAELHHLVRLGRGPLEILDRLLLSAIIEARSCERFQLLARHTDDAPLARLYGGLLASEARHYRLFFSLARSAWKEDEIVDRWHALLEAEAEIAARQPRGAHIL